MALDPTNASKSDEGAPPPGDNNPPLEDRLPIDYLALVDSVEALAKRAEGAPKEIDSDAAHDPVANLVKDIQSAFKKAEAYREDEKAPYLKGGQIVDSFFNSHKSRLAGMKERLEKRIKTYLDAKADRERKERQEAERVQRERERLAREEAERVEREARQREQEQREKEDRLRREAQAAENAKNAEEAARLKRQADAEAEERRRESIRSNQAIADAQIRADEERNRSVTAAKAANAKPADMSRTRSTSAHSTLGTFWKAEIIDIDDIPLEALRAHFNVADIQKAVDRAVATGVRKLGGVRIYEETKVQVR